MLVEEDPKMQAKYSLNFFQEVLVKNLFGYQNAENEECHKCMLSPADIV